jgi:hypothetical protein
VVSRKILSARIRYQGLANLCSADWMAGASTASDWWLYEMKALCEMTGNSFERLATACPKNPTVRALDDYFGRTISKREIVCQPRNFGATLCHSLQKTVVSQNLLTMQGQDFVLRYLVAPK